MDAKVTFAVAGLACFALSPSGRAPGLAERAHGRRPWFSSLAQSGSQKTVV